MYQEKLGCALQQQFHVPTDMSWFSRCKSLTIEIRAILFGCNSVRTTLGQGTLKFGLMTFELTLVLRSKRRCWNPSVHMSQYRWLWNQHNSDWSSLSFPTFILILVAFPTRSWPANLAGRSRPNLSSSRRRSSRWQVASGSRSYKSRGNWARKPGKWTTTTTTTTTTMMTMTMTMEIYQ